MAVPQYIEPTTEPLNVVGTTFTTQRNGDLHYGGKRHLLHRGSVKKVGDELQGLSRCNKWKVVVVKTEVPFGEGIKSVECKYCCQYIWEHEQAGYQGADVF